MFSLLAIQILKFNLELLKDFLMISF